MALAPLKVLTGSFDETARIHGLKSGKTLKEFRGHTSYVHSVCYADEGTKVLTASSDGSVRVWEVRSSDCLLTFRLGSNSNPTLNDRAIHTIAPVPGKQGCFFIANRTSTAYIVSIHGQVVCVGVE